MHPRTRARRRALDILFAADVLEADVEALLARAADLSEFALELVAGVQRHRAEIDGAIRSLAERWELERMPIVDRNVLRIAFFELLHCPQVPAGAAINDAVGLAKMLSTPDSGRFVNGLLGRLARERAS